MQNLRSRLEQSGAVELFGVCTARLSRILNFLSKGEGESEYREEHEEKWRALGSHGDLTEQGATVLDWICKAGASSSALSVTLQQWETRSAAMELLLAVSIARGDEIGAKAARMLLDETPDSRVAIFAHYHGILGTGKPPS
jgi:hypothetical protein